MSGVSRRARCRRFATRRNRRCAGGHSTNCPKAGQGTAVALLDRALLQARGGIPDSRLQGHLIRARAHLAEGDGEACAGDVETALSILPELNMLPREVLVALADLSAGVGPERMCDLIASSPAGDLLLPLRTALERELGLEPRVAREVEEIAEDIRRELLVRAQD